MSNRKTKKKKSPPSIAKQIEISKTYFEKYSMVARKTLEVLELDPTLFDRFTKRQKHKMMLLKSDPPRVKAKTGHSIPRHYIRKIQQEIYDIIKIYPVNNNREINLNYMDFLTYGICFLSYARIQNASKEEIDHKEIFQLIAQKSEENLNGIMMFVWQYLQYIMSTITKINIRIYGYNWLWNGSDSDYRLGAIISVSAISPRKIHFLYNNNYRPAFQAITGQCLTVDPTPITVAYNQVIENSDQTHPLDIYIQNHAFIRMKERIDVLPAGLRLTCLNSSLIHCQATTLNNGQRVIVFRENNTGIFGYLPFTIINKQLFILTFLPICSQNAPEGKKLQELLGISRKETEYLGMDKLSFFIDTDFEAIPRLKQAVIDAGLWHLTKFDPLPNYEPQNPMSTSTLIRFFQTERTSAEVLSEIEEMY